MDEKDIRNCITKTAKELGVKIKSLYLNPLTRVWHIEDADRHEQIRFMPTPDATEKECAKQLEALLGFGAPVLEEEIDNLRGMRADPDTILTAMQRIQSFGERAIEPLTQVLLHSNESPFRARAADTLARIASPKVIEILIQALNDPDVQVRWIAVKALARIGDENAIPTLAEVATNDLGAFSITPTLHIRVSDEARLAIDQINARLHHLK